MQGLWGPSTTWSPVTSVTWEGEGLWLRHGLWDSFRRLELLLHELLLYHTHHNLQVIWGPLAYY